MLSHGLTLAAFALMMLSDVLRLTKRRRIAPLPFFAGVALLLAACACAARTGERFPVSVPVRIPFLLLAGAALLLEGYSLLGALPLGPAYLAQGDVPLMDRGMYALCRHPGALWLPLLLGSLAVVLGSRSLLEVAGTASLLNLLYVWLQDRLIFPRTIPGYDSYRQGGTPFVFPTRASVQRALATRHQNKGTNNEV